MNTGEPPQKGVETGRHLNTLSTQLRHGNTFCLHTFVITNTSQLCKHLEITVIEPSRHSSGRNSSLPAVSLSLWLKCLLSSVSSLRLPSSSYRLFFHPRSDSSPIIVLVVKSGADPLCPLALILCYNDQSSCFRILPRHPCRVINWPHVSSGWCDTRGSKSRAGKWKNNALSFGLQKDKLWPQWVPFPFTSSYVSLQNCCRLSLPFRDGFFALLQMINKMWWHVRPGEATFTKPSLCDWDMIGCGCRVRTKCQ